MQTANKTQYIHLQTTLKHDWASSFLVHTKSHYGKLRFRNAKMFKMLHVSVNDGYSLTVRCVLLPIMGSLASLGSLVTTTTSNI